MKNLFLLFILLSLGFFSKAQTSLQGKVTAGDTGEELISANVVVQKNGVYLTGASTDFNGNYCINLDAGTYDLTVSYLGYPDNFIEGVLVKPGQVNKLDIKMAEPEGVLLDEIVVKEYSVPLIEMNNTTSCSMVTAEEISNLPVRNVSALSIAAAGLSQAERSDVTVRGSRADATDYYIDGVRVRGASSMIPASEVDDISVIIGGTPAAFGHLVEPVLEESHLEENATLVITKDRMPRVRKKEPEIKGGILTAGEWNGLEDWDYWNGLLETQDKRHQQTWQLFPSQRYAVEVVNQAGFALPDCTVKLLDKSGKTIWEAKTNNEGKANLWANLFGLSEADFSIIATQEKVVSKKQKAIPFNQKINKIELPLVCKNLKNLDIAFVVDATGSMGDEINYLKAELRDVIRLVKENNESLNIRTGSVFYRDKTDAYVTRVAPFSKKLNKTVSFIGDQYAGGGGDFEEAVDIALEKALKMNWSKSAVARILFLILDAPPHGEAEVLKNMQNQIRQAAKMGVRIVPITASGINQSTEFLMKTLAMTTNGTYTFITDHSGVGNPHLEATVSSYNVEMLNDLMVRLISEFSEQTDCETPKQDRQMEVSEGVDHSSSASNYLNQQIYFYPNPAEDHVFIELREDFSAIQLVHVSGKTVKTINSPKSGVRQIDLSDLPAGIYFLRFQKGTEVITKRLVISKS